MQPLVSVIIPTFNCESYIAETINSVLNQDYPSIELIIIDDGSTDKTRHIISDYKDKLTLITQNNSGVCVARNRGIKEAAGQFICLMDHDDYWFPDKISRQVAEFMAHPEIGIVYSSFTLWKSNSDGTFASPDTFGNQLVNDEIDNYYSGWIYHLLLLDSWVLTSTAMIRAEVFDECGDFDENLPYSEDWDLWLRVARKYPFLKLHRSTTLYRQHPGQGNRKIRPIDYRTNLLINAKKKWGLCSPNGNCLTNWQFRKQLAKYHFEFGLHHLIANDHKIAIRSFLKAWFTFPVNLKYLAYIPISSLGWRPSY
ncbi:Glycosyl transferase [Nitrosomonas nitrosa]|uniref:Glycosyl transferase n=1 Tax=Nitrosomonas nitrosa TaxID=52442 RepID=A0A8H9D7S5_9PROT|nr:glycosyltransferase [Nitrosomonas nitrosa]CAE6482824.1 Glycosyl transferase [Nitrosomonas nitrosa]